MLTHNDFTIIKKKRHIWRFVALFIFLIVVASIFVMANSFNDELYIFVDDDESSYYTNEYNNDLSESLSDENIYDNNIPYYNEYNLNYDYYNQNYDINENDFMGIMPRSNHSGPWGNGQFSLGYNNMELHISIESNPYPFSNAHMQFRLPPSPTATLITREHLYPGDGTPVLAGHSLSHGWLGFRRRISGLLNFMGGVGGNLNPSVNQDNTNAPMNVPTTEWMAVNNLPNARYYPTYLFLGNAPDITAFIRPSYWRLQMSMDDININDNNVPQTPAHNIRAIVGEYTPQNFETNSTVTNLRGLHYWPLQFQLPSTGSFEFANNVNFAATSVHHITTNDFINPNASVTVPVIPHSNLRAGTHTNYVTTYQQGHDIAYVGNEFVFTWHYSWPLSNLPTVPAYASTHRTSFETRFVVERPITRVAVGNQNRQNVEVDATLNVRDWWDDSPGPTPAPLDNWVLDNRELTYPPAAVALNHEITYIYDDPLNRRTSDIIVTVTPPDEYTFFDDRPASDWYYKDIEVIAPYGYVEVPNSRYLDDGDLVLRFARRRFNFEFFKTCMLIEYAPDHANYERNPLPGAVFELWWDIGNGWELAYTTQPSNSQGLVVIGSPLSPPLKLPAPPQGSNIVQMRIVEITPPTGGYALPEGDWWYLNFDISTWAPSTIDRCATGVLENDPNFVLRPVASGLSLELEYGEYEEYQNYQHNTPSYSDHDYNEYESYQNDMSRVDYPYDNHNRSYDYDYQDDISDDAYDSYADIGGYIGEAPSYIGITPAEYVDRWHVGNRRAGITFEFIKHAEGTVHNPLDGAAFRLDRWENGAWTIGVATDISKSIPGQLFSPHGYVSFTLTSGGIYRLTETAPPQGFITPLLSWRIIAPTVGAVGLSDIAFYPLGATGGTPFTWNENTHPYFDRYMLHLGNAPMPPHDVQIRKTDWAIYGDTPSAAIGLAGAYFRIRSVSALPPQTGTPGTGTLIGPTGADGILALPQIPFNSIWVLEEVIAPPGHTLPAIPFWTIEHTDNGNLVIHQHGTHPQNPTMLDTALGWTIGNMPRDPDWVRLNAVIHNLGNLVPAPTTIIIHPTNAGVLEGVDPGNNTIFNLVVTDPNPDPFYRYRTITTVPIMLPVQSPSNSPHRINVPRSVTVRAADGADIILRMPVPNSINTATEPRWATNITTLGRHFIIEGVGNFTLGGGTGTITVDGNANANAIGYRGGITVSGANATFNMQTGSSIYNNRSSSGGGGVEVTWGSSFVMHNGRIEGNRANNFDADGGGVEVRNAGSTFHMINGVIYNNSAANGGGAVHVINNTAQFIMDGGQLIENSAAHGGAVWIQDSAQFHMNGGSLLDNVAGIGPGTHTHPFLPPGVVGNRHGVGGGVKVCCSARFYMYDGYICGNTARVGGGVYLGHGGRTQDGGYVDGTHSYFTMHGGTIRNNRATLAATHYPGLEFDGDGGGVFMTRSGIFTMEGNSTKRFYNNIAENSGGGVRWVTGFWHTADNTSIVEFTDNEAALYGGGIYVGGGTYTWISGVLTYVPSSLTTYGNWLINENTAIRGGGVYIGENGTFRMTESDIIENTAEYGGGVYLNDEALFVFICGSIDTNTAIYNGGGVNVSGEGAVFSLEGTDKKEIIGNNAVYGGGVWVNYDAYMIMETGANNLEITENIASEDGGGIFTMTFEYNNPLTRLSGPTMAYRNLTLHDVYFSGNTAGFRAFSPINALAVIPATAWGTSLSACVHPLNNYDINFLGSPNLPMSGGGGMSIVLTLMGSTLVIGGAIAFIALNKRKALIAGYGNHQVVSGSKTHFVKVKTSIFARLSRYKK